MNHWLLLSGQTSIAGQLLASQAAARKADRMSAVERDLRAEKKTATRLARQARRQYRRLHDKKQPCMCGCGELTHYGWAAGHNMRGVGGASIDWEARRIERRRAWHAAYNQERYYADLKPCACGCGQLAARTWLTGHSGRGVNGFATYKEEYKKRKRERDAARAKRRLKPCACGCGQKTTGTYARGHNRKVSQ